MIEDLTSTGRLGNKSPKQLSAAVTSASHLRQNRRNQSKQAQLQKRQALVSATRVFSGTDGAPRIVVIVPLTGDIDPRNIAVSLQDSLDAPSEDVPESGIWRLR